MFMSAIMEMVEDDKSPGVYWLCADLPDSDSCVLRVELEDTPRSELDEKIALNLKITKLDQFASTLSSLFTFLFAN
jgi:hypothetical protein